ncbi:MAG: hypothetical protein Q7J29_13690 [Stagnimonas sp.]|nr:hypothetical protein [Stagnimonas sp.]
MSDALQIAANDSGITEGTLRNVLVRALSEPSQRVGWMDNLGDEAAGNLENALRAAIPLRVQAGPSAARAILSLLLSPLAAVAPQLLDIPPLVWKFPSLPDAAFDVKRALRSLEHWPSASDWARRGPEIRQVLDAWIESAREQFRRRTRNDPNHVILGDLEQAICLLREVFWWGSPFRPSLWALRFRVAVSAVRSRPSMRFRVTARTICRVACWPVIEERSGMI